MLFVLLSVCVVVAIAAFILVALRQSARRRARVRYLERRAENERRWNLLVHER